LDFERDFSTRAPTIRNRCLKQYHNLVCKCGFGFWWNALKQAKDKPRFFDSGPQNLDVQGQVEKFDMFRAAPPKSETTSVNQHSIL
jgi:hypothetical protein